MSLRHTILTVFAIAVSLLPGNVSPEPASGTADWQAACERSRPAATAVIPGAPVPLPPAIWTIDAPLNPDDVLSADLDRGALVVLNRQDAAVQWIDRRGVKTRAVGRDGEGPGDLRFIPVTVGSAQKLALLGQSYIGVIDGRRGNVFAASGRFIGRFGVDSSPPAMVADVQLATLDDSTFAFSQSGHWHGELPFPKRTELHLNTVTIRAGKVGSAHALGTLRNPLMITDSSRGRSGRYPYRQLYKRTWGAGGGDLLALPYSFFGVCTFAPDGRLLRTVRVNTPPRPTNQQEQDREITAMLGKPDAPNPFLKMTARQYLDGAWPAHAPFYYDLVTAESGGFVAVRLAAAGMVAADNFSEAGGYLRSYVLPPQLRLLRLVGDTLLTVDTENGEISVRALRR